MAHANDDRIPVNNLTVQEKAHLLDDALEHLRAMGELERFLGLPLRFAASTGNVDRMIKLLALGASANTMCSDGNLIIHKLAVSGNQSAAIQALLDYGAHVDALDPRGRTALELAALCDDRRPGDHGGSVGVISTLLRNGASVHSASWNGHTALHSVVETDKVGAISVLVEAGANVNARRLCGLTPLHTASRKNFPECVKALCNFGANQNWSDNRGDTAMEYAVFRSNQSALVALLDAGADACIRQRALNLAARRGNLTFVRLLLRYGADVTATDSKGRTALHEAAYGNQVGAIHLLLEAGADLHAADTDGGRTPLHRAAGNMAVEAVSALLKLGPSVNAPDGQGDTPLHRAARASQQDSSAPMIDALLRCGADESAVDGKGYTAEEVVHLDVLEGHVLLDSSAHGASNPSVRALLAKAKVWRRRRLVLLCRNRFIKAKSSLPERDVPERDLPERGLPARDAPEQDAASRPSKLARAERREGDDDAAGNVGNRGIVYRGAVEGTSGNGDDDDVECVVKKVVGVQELGIFKNVVKYL